MQSEQEKAELEAEENMKNMLGARTEQGQAQLGLKSFSKESTDEIQGSRQRI